MCHPYLSLSYYEILEDINIRSFVIGASNVLFKQKRHNVDVIVEVNTQLPVHKTNTCRLDHRDSIFFYNMLFRQSGVNCILFIAA